MDEFNVNPIAIISILAMLELYGWLYGQRVYDEPITPTWLEVVLGVGGTLYTFSAVILTLWGMSVTSAIIIGLAWYCFFATGKWQILYQHRKAQDFVDEWRDHRRRNRESDTGPLGEDG